jgi:hypothetical protein
LRRVELRVSAKALRAAIDTVFVVPVNDIGAAIRRGLPEIDLQTNLARAG